MPDEQNLNILLTTEGTYPYHAGGVGTWCHTLIEHLSDVNFDIFAIESNSQVSQMYQLPENIGSNRLLLQWQGRDHEIMSLGHRRFIRRWVRTSNRSVRYELVPLLERFFSQLVHGCPNPEEFSKTILGLNRYWRKRDYRRSFRNRYVWESYRRAVDAASWPEEPTEKQLTQGLTLIQNLFSIIAAVPPSADVTHSTAAAFCSIPAVILKEEAGTPFVLSEHGVYLRERLLSLKNMQTASFFRNLYHRITMTVVRLSYYSADRILPVCDFNGKWEKHLGVSEDKIRTIYNGVEPKNFAPSIAGGSGEPEWRPTIVSLARIDPLKDIETMLKAARIVRDKMPAVVFKLYGDVGSGGYYRKCLDLHSELELGSSFEFAGHTALPSASYQEGDLVVLSSISEAFPYTIVEAMMCGRPVVATDVGGVAEALADCGLMVEPKRPEALADACMTLLENKRLREELAKKAMARARSQFTVEKMAGQIEGVYRELFMEKTSTLQ